MTTTRRDLLGGRLRPPEQASGFVEVASVVVAAWPEHLSLVVSSIEKLGNCEVVGSDPRGKIAVVLEDTRDSAIGETITRISSLPHVISALLVFQASDGLEV